MKRSLYLLWTLVLATCLQGCCSLPTWFFGHIRTDVEVEKTIVGENPETISYTVCAGASDGPTVDGVLSLKRNELKDALKHFQAAVEGQSDDANAHFLLGITAELNVDYDLAIKAFRAASDLDKKSDLYADCFKRVTQKKEDL